MLQAMQNFPAIIVKSIVTNLSLVNSETARIKKVTDLNNCLLKKYNISLTKNKKSSLRMKNIHKNMPEKLRMKLWAKLNLLQNLSKLSLFIKKSPSIVLQNYWKVSLKGDMLI